MSKTSAHYSGKRGEKYFSDKFSKYQCFGRRYQSRYFAPYCSPDQVLLDYGCGDGTILRQLPAAKKIGIEVIPDCHRRIRTLNVDLDCPILVFDDIKSVANQTVDLVISNHSLEHTLDPFAILTELRRVLVPGGKLGS